jgi:hypothetical protein
MKSPRMFLCAALLASTLPLSAQTVDELLGKYVQTIGGMEKIKALQTLRATGKLQSGSFEAEYAEIKKRPEFVRQELTVQRLTGVYAYDGQSGWKIEPWQGKRDAEAMGEEELKDITEASDFDGPIIDPQSKGNRVEYIGKEPVEGTDTHKLKVTLKSGDIRFYYLDTDYFVPVKIDLKRTIRGAEREYEVTLGDYKEVNGVYLPHFFESRPKGAPNTQKITYDAIVANTPVDDALFKMPTGKPLVTPADKKPETITKKQNGKKPEVKEVKKDK